MDTALTINFLRPAAEYSGSVTDNDEASYDAIVWNDARPRPSWQDLLDNDAVALSAYEDSIPQGDGDLIADLLETKSLITPQERAELKRRQASLRAIPT